MKVLSHILLCRLVMRALSVTKRPSSRIQARAYASWWTISTTETCTKKSSSTRRLIEWSAKRQSGKFSSKCAKLWELFTARTSCIEIWKVLTFSCKRTEMRSLVIWTCRRSPRKDFCTRKQVRRTMRARKCGKINHTGQRVIFGPLAASCTKCARSSRPSAPTTWMDSTSAFSRDSTLLSTGSIRRSSEKC